MFLPVDSVFLISYKPMSARRFRGKVDIPCKGYKADATKIHVENKWKNLTSI